MKRHLTQNEIIDYQFKLCSDAQQAEFAQHLAQCKQCADKLESIKRKFASLDLLSDEIKASEALLAKTIEQAAVSKPAAKVLRFGWPAWAGAVAAVLVMAALFQVSNLRHDTTEQKSHPTDPDTTTEHMVARNGDQSSYNWQDQPAPTAHRPDEISSPDTLAMVHPTDPTAPTAPKPTHLSSIDDTPPFAPASAIELVTLPRRDNVQITIYNSADLTLVREQRKLTLKRGWNWLQFMWANTLIDPTSLSLEPQEQREKIDVQQLVFPPRLRELGRWLIRSEISGQVPFELTYFTSGLSWRAFYMGTLSQDETTMDLASYVRVANNSGEDYEDAQTRLIVGQVHILDQIAELAQRQHPYGSPILEKGIKKDGSDSLTLHYTWKEDGRVAQLGDMPMLGKLFDMEKKEIKKEGLSEYFLYTIEGTETIPNQWGKRLQSFEANDIEVESLYKYDESRYGNQTISFVKFANDEEHNLGETPIPNGQVRIYSLTDNQGHLSYVGSTSVKYIPVNEEVELNLGAARLVQVQPKLMEFKTENFTFDRNNDISGWDEIRTWQIEITNTRTLPVEIEITRGFPTTYWTLDFNDEDVVYEKYDATNARFTLNVQPRSKKVLQYTIKTFHGAREQAVTQ